MSEIRTSKLLAELIDQAKQVNGRKYPPFTAERFLVAVLDLLNEQIQQPDPERELLERALEQAVTSKTLLRQQLLSYIAEENSAAYLDDLYMKKKLQEVEALALAQQEEQITAVSLFNCIMGDPSPCLKRVLEEQHAKNETSQQELRQQALRRFLEDMEAESVAEEADRDVLSQKESQPKEKMAELVAEVKRIRAHLQSLIFGQDNAINVFTTGYFQANMLSMIDRTRKRPRATFLFAGPPGVGKTFLAEQAAEALKLPFKRFDMSEYADKEAHLEFCGTDKVYKNGKPGNVTDFVAKNPKCVLLFDEIEKAHMCVIHLFLQMLDAGRLRDNHTDEEVSFRNTIIILTTNAGRPVYEHSESGDFSGVSRKVIIKALQKDRNPETGVPFFPEALCSRFASGNVIMFNHMSANSLRGIAKKEIERHAKNLETETGIRLLVDDKAYTALLFSEGGTADARTVRSRAETFFNDELYELLRMIASEKAETNIADVEQIHIEVDLSRTAAPICELFQMEEKANVLVFAEQPVVSACAERIRTLQVLGTQSKETAANLLRQGNIDLILVDMRCGAAESAPRSLNIEDMESSARELLRFLREQHPDLPAYLLTTDDSALSEEERVSFLSRGIRDVLSMADVADRVEMIATGLHQQASMRKLARENKLISFSTAQNVSAGGKQAHIRLFDFRLAVAVDPEDTQNILSAVSKPNVRFEDVIGAQDAKKELAYFVNYLKDPKQYMGTGVKAPRGVLLYGPPGTGKTMLAKAMACEADVTFIAAEGNQFLRKYVGEGSEKVHELFRTARKYAPSILFIDEIDAIAKERKGSMEGSVGTEATLTAFLTEMDGFVNDPSRPVFVLAATNFDVEPGSPKSLDPALMRRFDRRVYIELPNRDDRIRFLQMKIERNAALDISQAQIENIAMRATGMSLADLDSALELALRSAIREGSKKVTDAILEEAFETFHGGAAKTWDATQLERVARHEAGHAFLCWQSGETPSYLTIVARGDHGGYMQHAEQEGKQIFTKEELLARIRTSLGGRAAEIVYYGEKDGISTGASGDLRTATGLAQQMVCVYGMDDNFGLAVTRADGELAKEVRNVVNMTLSQQLRLAIASIADNKRSMDALVEVLLQKNCLTGAEIEEILSKTK